MNPSATPVIAISVVIPVYNEQDVLQALFDRLYAVLDGTGERYEVIFVNDGSRDRTGAIADTLAAGLAGRPRRRATAAPGGVPAPPRLGLRGGRAGAAGGGSSRQAGLTAEAHCASSTRRCDRDSRRSR